MKFFALGFAERIFSRNIFAQRNAINFHNLITS